MSRVFGKPGRRLVWLVVVPVAWVVSGCSGNSADVTPGPKGVPPAVDQSNNAMQDFMKANKKGARR